MKKNVDLRTLKTGQLAFGSADLPIEVLRRNGRRIERTYIRLGELMELCSGCLDGDMIFEKKL